MLTETNERNALKDREYVEWVANHVYGCKFGQIQLAHALHLWLSSRYVKEGNVLLAIYYIQGSWQIEG